MRGDRERDATGGIDPTGDIIGGGWSGERDRSPTQRKTCFLRRERRREQHQSQRNRRAGAGAPELPLKRAHGCLLSLVIDLARDELGTAEVDQREYHVIADGEVARHIDEKFAYRAGQCRELSYRKLCRQRVVETSELEPSLSNEVRGPSVVEPNRDLLLVRRGRRDGGRCFGRCGGYVFRRRRSYDRHVFDRAVTRQARRRDVHLDAGAEDVLQ